MKPGALPETCGAGSGPLAWIRPGQVGYLGPDLGVGLHAASVSVLTVGLDAPFVLESPDHGRITTRSAHVPARVPHRVIAPEGRILLLFTDSATGPELRMGRRVGPYGLDHAHERLLLAACRHQAPDPELLRILSGPTPPAPDRRIGRLLDEIREDPNQSFRAEQRAHALGLSTSHFLRVFAQQTGTTFRRYQQWSRLLHVTRGISSGHDLTRCATDAGFASPSHLSDTFHRTLGTTASTVFGSQVRFELG